jgi:hypothetical protein
MDPSDADLQRLQAIIRGGAAFGKTAKGQEVAATIPKEPPRSDEEIRLSIRKILLDLKNNQRDDGTTLEDVLVDYASNGVPDSDAH